MEKNNKNKILLTPKQLQFMTAKAKNKAWVGNRGGGKSVLQGAIVQQAFRDMPRGKMILAGNKLQHLYNVEIPAIVEYLTQKGKFVEVTKTNPIGHFVVGATPPAYFKKPLLAPESYGTVISFCNGFHIQLVSLYKKDAGRGLTADCGILCEAATVDPLRFWSSLYPTVRGRENKYYVKGKGNPNAYLSWNLFSNMPWDTKGEWLFTLEEMAAEKPDQWYYQESTIWDAVCIYGKNYIEDLRYSYLKTNPLAWEIEYENKRVARQDSVFYSEMKEIHVVDETLYDYTKPLAISMDFNNNFNSLTVWQDFGYLLACIDELFIKGNALIDKLVFDFIKEYQYHHQKYVQLFGDANGNVTRFDEFSSLLDRVVVVLETAGWTVERCVSSPYNPDHALKQQRINKLFSEQDSALPIVRFEREGTYNTRASMKAANLTNKFRKDKSSENDRSIAPERATHLSDTVDYFLYEATKNKFENSISSGYGIRL